MEIIPLGHASFKLKGKNSSVVVDPFDPDFVNLKFPKHITADAVLISHDHKDHNHTQVVESDDGQKLIVFKGPGEYEIKGIEIVGVDSFHDNKNGAERGRNTIYHIHMDGINLVHLGDLGQTKLTDAQLDILEDMDVLFVPVGGKYTIDAKAAVDIVNQLEPSMVVPMHYKLNELAPVTEFLKEIGQENIIPLPKIKITKDNLPEKMQVVLLE